MPEAFIYDALRTPRGKGSSSGALYEVKPVELLSATLQALQSRHPVDPAQLDDTIIGCVTPIDDQGYNIAQAALLHNGWDTSGGSLQINRYCASGLEAVNLAAMKIRSGWGNLLLAGGVESMSRIPMGTDGGALLFDPEVMAGAHYLPQGVAADLIATLEGFSREMLDEYAYQSQQRARHAVEAGYFSKSLVPIYDRNGLLILDRDETVRPEVTMDKLSQLKPAFEHLGRMGFDDMALERYPVLESVRHAHTAGNSSGIVDGAALVLVGSEAAGKGAGLKPRAKIRAAATVSVDPTLMLTGPAPVAEKALQLAGMTVQDIDLWECNEAFASVVLKFQRELKIPDGKLNVNGGAIAMGHPLGATGAMLLGTLLDELERQGKQTGCVTLCAGGGMGISTIIERV
ncbi:MAG: acetyl-CoA C-acetyltransferase [Phaeodactylibacter xiamenensis]|uniref:Acetyl-CoA acetyltransferase n=1 Tax=Phaeodactylibacter xiamenensis TaxID=1524460 RepID=A0A098S5T7_9BACT|nr:acetyl-CoA C-acetyltransferase [Phaeodactylibacter xiamenensis]KGE87475.1 acetyl-CoA acetyltransferase [Phaeodactylibacter xiamenensis]MCR9055116.1 acetyl-CoA C-acetyltransferase [bacterium]